MTLGPMLPPPIHCLVGPDRHSRGARIVQRPWSWPDRLGPSQTNALSLRVGGVGRLAPPIVCPRDELLDVRFRQRHVLIDGLMVAPSIVSPRHLNSRQDNGQDGMQVMHLRIVGGGG